MNAHTTVAPESAVSPAASAPASPEPPIRAGFLPEERLRALGVALAKGEVRDFFGLEALSFQKRVRENADRILDTYRSTNAAQERGEMITPAAQWLLDNNYVVEETIFQVKRDLPRRFYRELPRLKLPSGGEVPRGLALAWLYVAHSDSAVSEKMLKALVDGYQTVTPFRIGELWSLPSLLRFVLIENLRRIATRVKRAREMRRVANAVADRVLASAEGGERRAILTAHRHLANDTTFATQLLYRLRDGSQNAGEALAWLEEVLAASGTDPDQIIRAEHQTLSSGNVTASNIIRGIRLLNDVDWSSWFETVSRVDEMLRERGDYAELDFQSRDQYRTEIEDLAKRSHLSEYQVAEKATALAAASARGAGGDAAASTNVGSFLVGDRRPELEREIGYRTSLNRLLLRLFRAAGWPGIVVPAVLLTAVLMAFTAQALDHLGLPREAVMLMLALFALPALEGAFGIFNTVVLLGLEPSRLVGYEFKEGVPDHARTLVVVPSLIGSRDDVDEAIRTLEVHHLANMKGALHFALLSDWPDSKVELSTGDSEVLAYAQSEIARLNARYPSERWTKFYILHRRRLYNPSEGCWMGWERKRGKLHELNLILRSDRDTTFLPTDQPLPEGVEFVMTLDADTKMTRDSVAKLVGKLCHPLNRPHFDAAKRKVTAGYSILQPRVTASLTTGDEASFFQRVFSANRGMDPYVFAVSDLYQDVFGQGTFTGKGLYHVDAMEAALKGRIPENAVLSHDLLEGSLARAALVTDVEVVEDYPTRYTVDASRQHRWARGDWQLLRYIFDPKSDVPALSRWKMVDNLRRSLTPILWVMAAVAGWTLLPFTQAAQWQALLILVLFMAPTFQVVDAILPKNRDVTARGHFTALARDVAFGTAMVAVKVVLMAHLAWMMGDAIVRTLYRLFVSRKRLLEWRPASGARKWGGNSLTAHYRNMYGAVVIALVGLAIPVAADSTGAFVAFFFALFWAGSPAFAWLISRSAETEDRLRVGADDQKTLRVVARRTWAYFERFVTDEHHALPPDNFQEIPAPVVAARTSPTNVGVYMLSVVSARDFGWISLADVASRLEATMTTLERMQRYRGHLYNWYETRTLKPLLPLYVSAVDSGNLAGHLLAVSAAAREWAAAPSVHLQGDFDGMLDVVAILDESLDDVPDDRRQLRPLRQRLRDRIDGMRRAVHTIKSQPEMASIRTLNLTVLASEIRNLAAALRAELDTEATAVLVEWAGRLVATCEAHVADAHSDDKAIDALRTRFMTLSERTRRYAFEMDFSFLLNRDRNLLSIGYRVDAHQLDESCYDLLASEARLTSLFAIAKGDIPTQHWFRLGRPIVEIGFQGALMSWSGSMFEYLMPPLVMKEPQGGILNQTNKLIVKRQIQYGRARRVPWGISEAAYNARDREMTYQYTNFGVPGLGLKRGLAHNTVIAPYATVLAAQFLPAEAVENLERLRKVGALGRYGYYDAVDYTPQRVPEGADCAVVRNYMAHHQGMSIVAVANAIFEGRMRDRFHSDSVIEAAELLLQEKAPRDIPVATVRTDATEPGAVELMEAGAELRMIADPARAMRATSVMSNGRYSVMLTARGAGYSRLGDIAVTRFRADPTEEADGFFLFLRDTETQDWWSATAMPRRAEGEIASTHFTDDKASFVKTVGTLRSEVECIVVSEGQGEGRRVTLVNEGETDRHIEVTSYAELALNGDAADAAHPAFSKMFVETQIVRGGSMILAERRKRGSGDPDIALAHFVTDSSGTVRDIEAETDRRAFLGRGRGLADAAAFERGARLGGNAGFTLDPVMALRLRVRVPANKKVQVTFWTAVGHSRDEVAATTALLDHPDSFTRQAMLAWTRSQVQTRHMGLSLAQAADVQRLARYLIYPDAFLRAPSETIATGLGSQRELWPMAISGDLPIFAVRISDVADLEIVAQALRCQEYIRSRGLVCDLVVINEQASSYVQDLQQAIENLCQSARVRTHELGPRQHIFAVRRDLMDETSYRTLLGVARILIHTRNGAVAVQVERAEALEMQARETALTEAAAGTDRIAQQPQSAPRPVDGTGLSQWNGYGGLAENGDYVIRLSGTRATPHPWINVIANERFGFHTSAEGASFTWSRNSRDFQLTPWSNDTVENRPGEGLYVYDHASRRAFSPFAGMVRDPSLVYEARHGQGFSRFSVRRGPLTLEATQLVDPADPVKITRLTIRNAGSVAAKLTVYGYAEWVLGNSRARTAPTIVTSLDGNTGAIIANNPYSLDFADRFAFLASDVATQSHTGDREEFLGAGGTTERPAAVLRGAALSGRTGAALDPCAALAREIEVAPGEAVTTLWLTGDAGSALEASELVAKHRAQDFDARLAENDGRWNGFLDTVQVNTPDAALNAMVNRWLPYQSLACRIRARSAFYQASGAFGFRDQLQDTLALLLHEPGLARGQILNAAARQFREGDVQHWWLPGNGAGVRTTIADDVVWLAHAAQHYVTTTGDAAILDETVPFIEGEALKPGEHDSFFEAKVSEERASLFEHCCRALDLAIARTGDNGLPLFLGGDWNDGMNRVGEGGKGESVWLGWFLLATLETFTPTVAARGDARRAARYKTHASDLRRALEATAWDGDWYRRGTYDDGTPLGSADSHACRIDVIAQAWSVLAGAEPARAEKAVDSAMRLLVDGEAGIVRLFTPPFTQQVREDPGYIKSYPPGVRENGGQYTHAATWLVVALARLGRGDDAHRCFSMLNPLSHATDAASAERYRVEPYVVAADIYGEGHLEGRGGWTWYTGSAGWLYRAAVEGILGIRREGDALAFEPAIPSHWDGFEATLRIGGTTYALSVVRDATATRPVIEVDGAVSETLRVPLAAIGDRKVVIRLPQARRKAA